MAKTFKSVLQIGLFFVALLLRAEGGRGFGNGGNNSLQKYLRHLFALRSGRVKANVSTRTQKQWEEQLNPLGNYHLLEKDEFTFLSLAPSLKDIPLKDVSNGTKHSLNYQNRTLTVDSATMKNQNTNQLFDEVTRTLPAIYKDLYPQSWALDYFFKHRSSIVLGLSAQEVKNIKTPQEGFWICYRSIFADLLNYSPTPSVNEEEEIIAYLSKPDFSNLVSIPQHPNSRHLLTVKQREYKKLSTLLPFKNAIQNKAFGNISENTKSTCPFIQGWDKP